VSRASATRRGAQPSTAGVSAPTDHRFRRPDVRPGRRRAGRIVVRAIAGTVVMVAALGASAWLFNAVVDSPYLRVQHIVVQGATRLSSQSVEAQVDGVRGLSILRLDLEIYRRRLMDSPWVKDVTFSRRLPSTVNVRIIEREPMAIARLGHQLYLVDAEGVITDQYGPQYADLDFPIVDGLVQQPAAGGAPVDAARLGLVMSLLDAIGARPELRDRLSQVDVSNAHDAVVVLDGDPARLHLGDSRFAERMTTYLEMAPALGRQYAAIDYADLRFDGRVFVRPTVKLAEKADAR